MKRYSNYNITTAKCCKEQFLKALIGYHCFTGCDNFSAFSRRGKLKPLSLMCNNESYVEAFSTLGTTIITDEIFQELGRFVCHMYGKRPDSKPTDVNSLR